MAKKKNEEYSDDDQDYVEEPNFDDPEGFVDDINDEGMLICQHGRPDHAYIYIYTYVYTYIYGYWVVFCWEDLAVSKPNL